ncbi:MAG: tetratricopeptide repeat protein [Gemmatimonadetes bacterium]|nr:tetratricopeptide repeat protein [Gemmatimonadota bacterium]
MAEPTLNTSTSASGRRQLASLLPATLKRLLAVAVGLAGFMLADTLYLLLVRLADRVGLDPFALDEATLPPFYQVLLLAHTGAGLLLAVLMAAFLIAHLPRVWRRFHHEAAWTGVPYAAVGVGLVVTGLFIFSEAATRGNSWVWWLHSGAAVLALAGYAAHRAVSHTRPPATRLARFLGVGTAASLVLFIVHGGLAMREGAYREAGERPATAGGEPSQATARPGVGVPGGVNRDAARMLRGDFGPSGWVPTGAVPPESPFFPSPATTTTGDFLAADFLVRDGAAVGTGAIRAEAEARGFASETRIGSGSCERCHADIVDQWATSAHRFASFNNPFYEATIAAMRSEPRESNRWIDRHLASPGIAAGGVGRAASKWCSGCHDPVLLFAGGMGREIDRNSPAAQAGLTCLSCHAIDHLHDRTGNGNYNIADAAESPYIFAGSPPRSLGGLLHDAVIRSRPAVHSTRMLKPFFRESTYCATCHKVGLSEPVNNYRWLRGQNEFDSWDDSGVSLNAARTFYLPPAGQVCQDCHMPLEPAPRGDMAAANGMVRSHRFLGANTALPYLRGDTATLRRIEDFLGAEKLRVDVFAVRVGAAGAVPRPAEQGAGAAMPEADGVAGATRVLADRGSGVPAGVPVTFDVVVRNLGVGHTFPGGTNDSNEGWIEFTVTDEDGRRLAASGLLADDGHLDPFAHTFKAVMVDRDGNAIRKRNAQDIHATVYANVIGPGSADVAHYELTLPPELAGSEVTVSARLLWRKFDRVYTEFAFETNPSGFGGFDAVPDLPVTEITADSVRVLVTPGGGALAGETAGVADRARMGDRPVERPRAEPVGNVDWTRHNDYGIALLLEGDHRRAAEAFSRVEMLEPGRIDGPLNLARTALAEGNLVLVFEALARVEAIEAGNARAAWVWGQALREDGRYEEAAQALRRVLEVFPDDRAAWRSLGRTLFLDGRYAGALGALDRVLAIDPEDRVAHYHRMLSLRALGRDNEAAQAEAAYLYHGIDEAAQEITRAYRARDPGANIMAQQIPVHRLEVIR